MRTVKRHVKDKLPVVRLTEKELVRLMKATFATPRLEQVRDLFIFSCFTGLHYQNLKEIRKQHLRTKYGLQWVVMERALTEAPIHIPLLAIPQMILEKYKLRFKETEHILPVPSNQRLNVYLKEIGEMCDIRKNMTMYLAIHTFKETIAAGNGLSSGAVCKMLGFLKIVYHWKK